MEVNKAVAGVNVCALYTYDRVFRWHKLIRVIWVSEDRGEVNWGCNVSHQVQAVIGMQRLGRGVSVVDWSHFASLFQVLIVFHCREKR